MARGYAACLGAIALAISVLHAATSGDWSADSLSAAAALGLLFAAIGYAIGAVADGLIRQAVEADFRRAVEQYRQRVTKTGKSELPS